MTEQRRQSHSAEMERLSAEYERDPEAFRRSVLALMRRGYAYIYGVGCLILGLFGFVFVAATIAGGGVAAAWVLFVLGGILIYMTRTLRVRPEPPDGVRISRGDAPELFATIDELRRAMKVGKLGHVFVTGDLDVEVRPQPRAGMPGWYRTHLLIGLPLMSVLSRDGLRAALARELAHVAGGDDGMIASIWSLRIAWVQLGLGMKLSDHEAAFIFRRFFRKWAPSFEARAGVLLRHLEGAADEWAVELAGREAAIDAAVTSAVRREQLVHRLWPELRRQSADLAEPPDDLFDRMSSRLREPSGDDEQWLTLALARRHPERHDEAPLRERLRTYGLEGRPAIPPPPAVTAAEHHFGDRVGALARAVTKKWRSKHLADWREEHIQASQDQDRLERLDRDAADGELASDERRERALLTARLHPERLDVRAQLEAACVDNEGDPALCLALGRQLVRDGDERGVLLLERVANERPEHADEALSELSAFRAGQGREEEAAGYLDRSRDEPQEVFAAMADLLDVSDKAPFERHGLQYNELAPIVTALGRLGTVEEAWLARQTLERFPDVPCFVLLVKSTFEGRVLFPGRAERQLDAEIEERVPLPKGTFVVFLDTGQFGLLARMQEVPGSCIYSRPGDAV